MRKLILAAAVGKRVGFPHELQPPHNPGMTMAGAGMLWVGWYGFNGGSALAANADAAAAIACTHMAASTAGLTWAAIEWIKFKRPSLVGLVTGAVAGLATVTPASGSIGIAAASALGVVASLVCFFMVQVVRKRLKIDDALDVFAVHGVGGMFGAVATGVFASAGIQAAYTGLLEGNAQQLVNQLIAVVATVAYAVVATFVIIKVVDAILGIRVTSEHEEIGLDLAVHGEAAYQS